MKHIFAIVVLYIIVSSCQKEEPKSAAKDLLTFSFKQANNAIDTDAEGVIIGKEIKISLPSSVALNNLKATFTSSPLATVTVNGKNQISGTTANDFTNPVTYKVKAEDGSMSEYTVTVSKVPSAEKQLTGFFVNFKTFSGAPTISKAKASGNNYTIFMPPHINPKSVKVIFTTSLKTSVSLNNKPLVSNDSIDLSAPITLTVIAEDKSTQNYTITPKSVDQEVDNLVNAFVKKYDITGLTFAISNQEKLMYAKGYGYADKANNTPVTPYSLFRIASVSKPITAIAVMKLIEDGKLSLDDKVFGDNGILGNKYGGKPYRNGYENITVKHLLEHTAGVATNDGNDPMFSAFNLTQDQIIENAVKNRNLYATPGTKYYYSNLGYCMLGRIIEKVSGMTYEQYLQKAIFEPTGTDNIQLTGNTIANRKENEVVYYSQTNSPYAYNVARMDSHGGLIASSIDLLKLISHVDGFNTKPDILKPETIATMTKYNAANGYALGWSVNQANYWWHTGLLIGTSSELVRSPSGFSWAIIANYGELNSNDQYVTDLDNLGWNIISAIKDWPEYDLF
ncbi:serine hydrolase [Emticicia agri]|nr:serine hydrolase [Emticicia agri]